MKLENKMNRISRWVVSGMLVVVMGVPFSGPMMAQSRSDFYKGVRDRHPYNDDYDRQRYRHHRSDEGGIGPGKGALIGGAAGAALGALFGGGLKGALIGGGAGAGVGAIAGKANQDNKERDYRERYDRHGRPY
jgi:hypothetical protein